MLRFPRRNPLSLLILLIPLSLLLYAYFGNSSYNYFLPVQQPATSAATTTTADDSISDSSNILLVSAFFSLTESSRANPRTPERISLTHLLSRLQTDVYLFAPPSAVDFLHAIHTDDLKSNFTLDTRFSSPSEIPHLSNRPADYTDKIREADRDRARARQTWAPEFYASENAKVFFLAEALRQAPSTYKHAFYVDASSFFDHSPESFVSWPDSERVDEVWREGVQAVRDSEDNDNVKAEELLFVPVRRLPDVSMQLWNENFGPVKNDFVQRESLYFSLK